MYGTLILKSENSSGDLDRGGSDARHLEPGKQQRYCGWSWEGSGQGRGSERTSGNSIYIRS